MDANSSFMRVVEQAHEKALLALTDSPPRPDEAVAWLSAHLAAVQTVIYPTLAGTDTNAELLGEQLHATRDLLAHTRTLELAAAGGAIPSGTSTAHLREHLVDHLSAHSAAEHALLAALTDHLDDDELDRLTERYDQALRRGPTRPHPWGRHTGTLGRVRFTLDALRDRVLDVLDARPVPIPRRPRRPARAAGAWGAYALGAPLPVREETERREGNRGP